eukprot:gb/GECG01009693.1/.p1 GENE.gb/GECG01009693.1/~~gb/GECG01009693.1/.p1  ORF type:complete len:127 (+),score=3.87 gb/GECG01009693.1/:1-381(+)
MTHHTHNVTTSEHGSTCGGNGRTTYCSATCTAMANITLVAILEAKYDSLLEVVPNKVRAISRLLRLPGCCYFAVCIRWLDLGRLLQHSVFHKQFVALHILSPGRNIQSLVRTVSNVELTERVSWYS